MQDILEKAITKAIEGGWKSEWVEAAENVTAEELISKTCEWLTCHPITTQTIIFNHDFAKALWGDGRLMEPEEYVNTELYDIEKVKAAGRKYYEPGTDWQYHLQMMVIADDPIKYLGENI